MALPPSPAHENWGFGVISKLQPEMEDWELRFPSWKPAWSHAAQDLSPGALGWAFSGPSLGLTRRILVGGFVFPVVNYDGLGEENLARNSSARSGIRAKQTDK